MISGIVSTVTQTFQEIAPMLAIFLRIGIALLIVAAGFVAGRVLSKFTTNALKGINLNGLDPKKRKWDSIAGSAVKYFIYVVALILALNQIGLAFNVLNNLVIVLTIIIAIGLFLSVKDFVPNAISGIFIISRHKIEVGQTVKIKGIEGKVKKIDLLETKLETKTGHSIMIPNSYFVKNPVLVKNVKRK